MTSGNFASFPVHSIWLDRSTRQRREINGIDELSQSIQKIGLINPLTIKRDGELVAGERRWNAIKLLGWTNVSVQFLDELDDLELQLLELEENTRRAELPWQDQCVAVAKYDALQRKLHPDWNMTKTAEALGIADRTAQMQIAVALELKEGNERVASAPRYSIARGIVSREAERKRTSIVEEAIPDLVEKIAPLLNVDFHEWSKSYAGPKFNFIHCDFPYGVNADKHAQGAAASMGGYSDSADIYFDLIGCLANAMDNVVAESAHLMFWFSMDYYYETLKALKEMGWEVSPFPLVWHKSDNMGILPDPSRGPRRIYETCFHGSRGDRKIIRAISNVVSSPTTKEIHMSEKPQNVLEKFFEMFVDQYSSVLDPTCGSASSCRAASARGASTILGLELDPTFYQLAKERYFKDGEDE